MYHILRNNKWVDSEGIKDKAIKKSKNGDLVLEHDHRIPYSVLYENINGVLSYIMSTASDPEQIKKYEVLMDD